MSGVVGVVWVFESVGSMIGWNGYCRHSIEGGIGKGYGLYRQGVGPAKANETRGVSRVVLSVVASVYRLLRCVMHSAMAIVVIR